MNPSFATYLNFAILTQCLFSIAYLSSFQWSRNKWLVLALVATFLLQLGIFQGERELWWWEKMWVGNPGFLLLIFPAMYLFTRELVSLRITGSRLVLHFLPALLFYLVFLFHPIYHPRLFIAQLSQGAYLPIHWTLVIVFAGIMLYYGSVIWQLIRYNQQKYQEEYAERSIYLTLDWLKYVLGISSGISLLAILSLYASRINPHWSIPFAAIELFFLVVVMALSFFAFRQPSLYAVTEASAPVGQDLKRDNASTAKPLLSPPEVAALSEKLDRYLMEEQPFLQANIRMPSIAAALGLRPNAFSWYLNEHHQVNFFTFINRYRIEYAVALLQREDHRHYTIEAISKMSGFRSKTTFNNRFKEIMTLTPSHFREAYFEGLQP